MCQFSTLWLFLCSVGCIFSAGSLDVSYSGASEDEIRKSQGTVLFQFMSLHSTVHAYGVIGYRA